MNARAFSHSRPPVARWIKTWLFVVLVLLAGCKPESGTTAAKTSDRTAGQGVSVMIDSVNYMHERGVQYTLYDLVDEPPRAIGGSIVVMLASGGEKGCCLMLPRTWHPGIRVRLAWQESDRQQTYPEHYSRDLEIPRYDTPADLYVVFYPPHEIELVVSAAEPGHPEWRGSIKKTPWEQCLATYGRKPCKWALPKMFDTGSSQGFCTWSKEEKYPDTDGNCALLQHQCMSDYEDEVFCVGVLWGARKK